MSDRAEPERKTQLLVATDPAPGPELLLPDVFSILPFTLATAEAGSDDMKPGSRSIPIEYLRLLRGIDWLLEQEIDLLSLSLGPVASDYAIDDPIQVATRTAVERGVPVVVSAGNRGPGQGSLQPLAQAPWVIAVGAVDESGKLLASSSRGWPEGPHPTVVALGSSEAREGLRDYRPGTSFAAARVAGVAVVLKALLQSLLNDLLDLEQNCWSEVARPLRRPVLGLADTGVDPAVLLPPSPLVELFYQGQPTIRINHGDRERGWRAELLSLLKQRGLQIPRRVQPEQVKRVLQLTANPLPGSTRMEVGAGQISDESAFAGMARLTIAQWLWIFFPGEAGAGDVRGAANGSEPNPWEPEQLQLLWMVLRDGIQLAVAKVI